MLTKTELAYAAGIVDGEGCIRINKVGKYHVVRMQVTNTNPKLIDLFIQWFGGYVTHSGKPHPNRKPVLVWEASAKRAESILRQIKPYLILKAPQAEIALTIRATKVADASQRESCFLEMKKLNQRGIHANT